MALPKCKECDEDIPIHIDRCNVCGADVGFPNVRLAEGVLEADALLDRCIAADRSAVAKNSTNQLDAFCQQVNGSFAVMARNLQALHSLVMTPNTLFATFHNQVDAKARVPEDNPWDMFRGAADGTVLPLFYRDIHYACLSLDGKGVRGFGDYSIIFDEAKIADRASVFEENGFHFCQRHGVAAGTAAPPGYRSTWSGRSFLAKAKLHSKIDSQTAQTEFADILLDQATSNADADFIEVHIYGTLHPKSIRKIIGPKPASRQDRLLWDICISKLSEMKVELEET